MALIASIDGTVSPRLIYLSASTVGATINPIDLYKEMRVLRRTDETLRKYDVFMKASGNDPKGSGKFTERYVTLLDSRIVPYDTTHVLTINGTVITDDGFEGIFAFDKSPLSPTSAVDISYIPPQVEIITISSGSGLDQTERDKLLSIPTKEQNAEGIWNYLVSNPHTVGSFGEFISKKVLTISKFLGLK